MLWWIVDNAFLMYFLLGFVAVALGALWWFNRDWKSFAALVGVLLLMLGVYLLTLFIVTDRGQLRNNIVEIAEAFESNNSEKIIQHLADNFQFSPGSRRNITRAEAARAIHAAKSNYGISDVHVWNFSYPKLDRSGKKATIEFHARVSSTAGENLFRCQCDFVLVGDRWLLQQPRIYDPIRDTEPLQIPGL